MSSNQVEASLEDVLKQYEDLINSSNHINKNEMVSDLEKLYQLSAMDGQFGHLVTMYSSIHSPKKPQPVDNKLTGYSVFAKPLGNPLIYFVYRSLTKV